MSLNVKGSVRTSLIAGTKRIPPPADSGKGQLTQPEILLSFRKLFANGRALFANDPGDRHPSLNKYKGPGTLIVTYS